MDHEKLPCEGPNLGMCGCDRELFDRVWKRVMPEERADCPIVVTGPAATAAPLSDSAAQAGTVHINCSITTEPEPEPTPEPEPMPEPMPEPVPEPEPSPEPEPEEPAPGESSGPTGDDFPGQDAVPCLGSASAGHGEQLQQQIMEELEGWQLYRQLARRVTGASARSLSTLASEKHRHARRLAAAYFLISGVRYWPTDRLETPRVSTWLGTLRRRFAVEQQMESRYRAAAIDTTDPCLSDLYAELADSCAVQAGMLRTLLESAL